MSTLGIHILDKTPNEFHPEEITVNGTPDHKTVKDSPLGFMDEKSNSIYCLGLVVESPEVNGIGIVT